MAETARRVCDLKRVVDHSEAKFEVERLYYNFVATKKLCSRIYPTAIELYLKKTKNRLSHPLVDLGVTYAYSQCLS